ncbi:ABC transporter substrate-binding protein [Aquincola sp. MAHUQ-54]|uniref:ABC transporter substrate-binding protein n=1 Tax=Aquincola agrisoli TaxID=3119538 RepID=A0AAW9QQU4_9BURK
MPPTAEVRAAFLPTGVLRASINLGNPILAGRDAGGAPAGISVDLARHLADRLDAPLELVVFDAAGKSVAAVTAEEADIGFFAVDPLRAGGLHFTRPYVLIEGSYLVRQDSALQHNGEVDAAGTSVMVGKGSAYDLYLTRELKHATILRAPTSPKVVEAFLAQQADVAAGVRQQLEADAAQHPGLRLLPGRFMVIEQAMGMPRGRSEAAAAYLRQFVEDMKRTGVVAESMRRHGIQGAVVAPPSSD